MRGICLDIYNPGQLQDHRVNVIKQAGRARAELNNLMPDPMEALRAMKFERMGFNPLDGTPLNLIEQLNQTFHDLASFAAASYLLERFPQCEGLRLAPQFAAGSDIASIMPGLVAAEVFAAVSPTNNLKLKKDAQKVDGTPAEHRFVFFYSPNDAPAPIENVRQQFPAVQIRPLTWGEMLGQR